MRTMSKFNSLISSPNQIAVLFRKFEFLFHEDSQYTVYGNIAVYIKSALNGKYIDIVL